MGFNLDNYREALIAERAGYLAKGKTDKAANVDKELARLDGLLSTGHKTPRAEQAPIETKEAELESKTKKKVAKKKKEV
jgi:hypothetical protein